MSETSVAQSGLEIMTRQGEAAGRQWLLEHAHQEAGHNTAARTGTLILSDGSSVSLSQSHYAFRWTQDRQEFSPTHPTSEQTNDWPELGEPLEHAPLAEMAATILVGNCEDERRRCREMNDRKGAEPRLSLAEAARAAPSLPEIVERLVNGKEYAPWLDSIRDQFLDECAEQATKQIPTGEQESLVAATDAALALTN